MLSSILSNKMIVGVNPCMVWQPVVAFSSAQSDSVTTERDRYHGCAGVIQKGKLM